MLLLSLTFGGQGLGFPGFGFPWQDRRIAVPDLRVAVVPAQVTPVVEPVLQAGVEQPVVRAPATTPSAFLASTSRRTATPMTPEASPRAVAKSTPAAATGVSSAKHPLGADRLGDTASPPVPAPDVIAVAPNDEATWSVPAEPPMPTPVVAATPGVSSVETAIPSSRDAGDAARAETAQLEAERKEAARAEAVRAEAARAEAVRAVAARAEAARGEAARVESARVDAARVEAARVEAARLDAARAEAARGEAARAEAARAEAARGEAARVEAAQEAAARIEAARVEAARVEAARVDAARAEAARGEAARAEAARAEAARGEAARAEAAQEAAASREAKLRAIGRQLDEEAARLDAATAAARQSPSAGSARRYRLFGRTDPNTELILYAEAWSRKIQVNMTFNMVRDAAKQPHTDPVVTVAVRSDGSVESVTFVQSSGVAALDEAIRRVVQSQTPYAAFPPAQARQFVVLEISRTGYLDFGKPL